MHHHPIFLTICLLSLLIPLLSHAVDAGNPDENHSNAWKLSTFENHHHNLREMTTDRGDLTGTPFTVMKGFFHLETGIFDYERRLHTEHSHETFNWGEINARYGLTDALDFQLIWRPYTEVRKDGDTADPGFHKSGVNDLFVRFKYNLIGNEGGDFALAVLPFVKVPVATGGIGNDMWEGGLKLISQKKIGGNFTFGSSLGANISVDEDESSYLRPTATAQLGFEITEKLGAFTEIYASWSKDDERYWQTAWNFGLDYDLTEHIILDVGLFWFFRGEEALTPFIGISWRF